MRDADAGCWAELPRFRLPFAAASMARYGMVWHGMAWHNRAVGHGRFSGPYGQPSPSSHSQNQGLAVTCFSDPAATRRAVHSNPEIGQREKGISRGAAVAGA